MCGIGGIILLDRRKTLDKELQISTLSLMYNLQKRGTSAWGVYIEKTGHQDGLYCGDKSPYPMTGELFKRKDSV